MKGNGLAKLYDRLSLDERFRLRVRALARGDVADCARLDRATPTGQSGAYGDRLYAAETLALSVMAELLPRLAKLQMVGALRPLVEHLEGAAQDAAWLGYLDGYAAGWKAAGERGEPPAVADDDLAAASRRAYGSGTRSSALLDQLASELEGRARTPRDALAAFAEDELGVSVDDLLGAWAGPARDTLAGHREALDAAEPDVAVTELLQDLLRLGWRRHGLDDETAEVDDALRAMVEAVAQRGGSSIDA